MTETIADLVRARFGLETAAGRDQPADGALASILRRRTHRHYTAEKISDELLQILLACALSAPSKSDLQQASILVVRDPERRRRLAALVPSMPWIGEAPLFLVFCADHRRVRRISQMRRRPFANDNLDGFMNAVVDAALVLETFTLAAEAAGLGCCAISVIRDHIETVTEILELPAAVFPLAGLCVGYPANEGYLSMRLPPRVTVHVDRYQDSDLETEIDAYDRRRDAAFSIPAARQKYRELYGEAEFYGWSEDKARQESRPEREDLRGFLESHGFSLA